MTTSHIEHRVATAFARDVAEHRMIVKLDHGLHRHLVFEQREHAWNDRFELITAPGSLTITGDRGAHTFRRMTDMFQFFRMAHSPYSYGINPGYWAEKLPDSGRSVKVYSEGTFKALLDEHMDDWRTGAEQRQQHYELDKLDWDTARPEQRWPRGDIREPKAPKTLEEIWEVIEDHQHYGIGSGYEDGARELLRELERIGVVSDTWEWDLSDWDYHFLHNLHAIAWGVQQYDNAVKSGRHVVRSGPAAWDVPLPTIAPKAPAPRKAKPAKAKPISATITLVAAGGVL